ncbi:MAG TPA: FtsX-like permease family protein [Chloroflexi bacterium]|nr:FtsX-like permease family protein [Chloroflexota bacterium]
MSIVWRKVWRDLWNNKLRTILVVLSTAVGVFALGLVFGASGMMRERMTESHIASNAPNIEMYTHRFGQDLIYGLMRETNVADVEGESRISTQWKFEGEDDWRDANIIARQDLAEQRMYPVELLEGEWPDRRSLAVERMSSSHYNIPIDKTILVKVGNLERQVPIVGVARHPYTPPPQIGLGNATFIATTEMQAWLTNSPEGFNALNIQLASFSEEEAQETAARIKKRLERGGMEVYYHSFVKPDEHWAQQMIDTIFLVLGVLGGLSLVLSGFLIVNTMNAIITQQIWQIGVMKVLGATVGRVVYVYLITVVIYALLSLGLAMPLGAIGAHLLSAWMLDLFNIMVGDFRLISTSMGLQVGIGLIIPLLAALVPVLGGARISAAQAISNYGLGGQFGRGILDRVISRIRSLPRPTALSLRNTFRRKARVALTLLALTIGGVMFLMVLSVGASFRNTIDVLLNDFGFDVLMSFDRSHRVQRLVQIGESVDGVNGVEIWEIQTARFRQKSGEEITGQLWGVPDRSRLFTPRIVEGRTLSPDDDRAILLNHKVATDENIRVGDTVALTVAGKEALWTVVGTIININNNQRDHFVSYDALVEIAGNPNRASFVMMTTEEHDAQTHIRIVEDLRTAYEVNRIKVTFSQTAGELREQINQQFDIITVLMLTMAILAGIVGGMGLMGTMSINVVERGREIGVMRSIGATSIAIAGIFVFEGMLVGALSWALAVPISYPGAAAFSQAIGMGLMELALDFKYPVSALMLWLAIVLVISAVASLFPAWRATRVSVRESLAYE